MATRRADSPRRLLQQVAPLLVTFAVTFVAVNAVAQVTEIGQWHDDFRRTSSWHGTMVRLLVAAVAGLVAFWCAAYRRARRLQAELAEGNDRYRCLFEMNPDATFALDLDGRFISANAACANITGYRPEELSGQSFVLLLAPEDRQRAETALTGIVAGGAASPFEASVCHRDGRRMEISVTTMPILTRGRVVGAYAVAHDVTAANQTTRELSQLHTAMQASTEGVAIVDADHNLVYLNRARAGMHGHDDPRALLGKSSEVLYASGEYERVATEALPQLAGEGAWAGEIVCSRTGGATFTAEMSLTLLPNGGVVSVTRDISARKAAEDALRASEERFRDSLAEITEGYFETDLAGDLDFFNDALCHLTRLSDDQLRGRSYLDHTDKANAMLVVDKFGEVFTTGKPNRGFEWVVTRGDGEVRNVETSVSLVRDESGEPVGFRGVFRDITERKRAEEQLRREYERHRLALRATEETMFDSDLRSGKIRWAGALEAMFGIGGDEVVIDDADWEARVHPEDREPVRASLEQFFSAAAESSWSREYRIAHDTDGYRSIFARGHLVRDNEGQGIRFVGTMLDITDRKRHELELRQARREAEQANEAKSEFLANMSHELRTPMHSVIGIVDLLMDSDLDEQQHADAATIRRSGEILLQIINEVLDLSKVESGKLAVEKVPFDLAPVITDVVSVLENSATPKGLALTAQVDPDVPARVLGDPLRIQQVLTNLVGNAIKFTDEGRVRVSVSAGARADTLRFDVADTGLGMTPAEQERVFQPFTQADSSTARHFGGTGLGLAIARELIDAMDGRIWVTSESGLGSVFSFEVPLPETTAEAQVVPRCASPVWEFPVEGSLRRGHDSVLLVEDHPVNQGVAARMIRKLGYTVDVVDDGLQALEATARTDYAVMLLDAQMPNLDGYETTLRLRARELATGAARLPVVAMTANVGRADRERAREAGMDDYLAKPYRKSELAEVLRRWVGPGEDLEAGAPELGRADAAAGLVPVSAELDEDVVEDLRDLGPEFVADMTSEFRRDLVPQLRGLADAVTVGDTATIREVTHRAGGAAAILGARGLATLLNDLQSLASEGHLEEATRVAAALADTFDRSLAAVEAALSDGSRQQMPLVAEPAA